MRRKISFFVFLGVLLAGFLLAERAGEATEDDRSETVKIVEDGIRALQPWFYMAKNPRVQLRREREFFRLVSHIHNASVENQIPPQIAVVVGFRESSLLPSIQLKTGSRGERGYFQVMPGGLAIRVCGNGCNQNTPRCNAQTAMCYLAYCRDLCGENPWQYVGGYGRSRCPESVTEAQSWREVRRARKLLCNAYGEPVCDEVWPTS